MTSNRAFFASVLTLLFSTTALAADQPACGHSLDSAPKTVQSTLTPAYADSAKVDLKAVSKQMNGLMLEIGRCQAMAQDPSNDTPDRNHDIAEWQSLNQWMYRLTSFVDQNARGDHHMDWKREFELFQDVYELKR